MKDILKTGIFLLITCAISAILLAVTEQVTAPKIKAFKEKSILEAKQKVIPTAKTFKSVAIKNSASDTIDLALDAAGQTVGYVVQVAPKGYAGPIEMVVGINKDYSINKVIIQTMRETPGLGTKLADETEGGFLKKFIDKCASIKEPAKLHVKKDGGEIDAITAATVSSRAFCKGVNQAIEKAKNAPDSSQQSQNNPSNNTSKEPLQSLPKNDEKVNDSNNNSGLKNEADKPQEKIQEQVNDQKSDSIKEVPQEQIKAPEAPVDNNGGKK
ncbi:MAG: RnfABCDGE type electron transport complex subunit G [Candidatus Riflebacteria bacterium]|nr:RnfABCDGE type electron transport complex subunit G [Candidatus Riflebacteria bacterium]